MGWLSDAASHGRHLRVVGFRFAHLVAILSFGWISRNRRVSLDFRTGNIRVLINW
jgi:hypothetical protein